MTNSSRSAPVALFYGFSLTFASSVGQTFFFSLFVPSILLATRLSSAELASLYSAGTLLAALLLPIVGRPIDRMSIGRFGLLAGLGALVGCLVVASTFGLATLFVGIVLLRLFGQGLLPHAAMTGIARYAGENRGKALAVVSLGYCAGEGVLPLLLAWLLNFAGWRLTYAGFGVAVGLVVVPLVTMTIRNHAKFNDAPSLHFHSNVEKKAPLLRSTLFWCCLPILMLPPLALTALLFLQTFIAEAKGLSLVEFTAGFVGYALIQVPAAMFIGFLVDRFGSRLTLLLHLLPLVIGPALLALRGNLWTAWIFLALAGSTAAASSILRTTAVADLVPHSQLGSARSLVSSILLIGAAAGPALYGAMMELGLAIDGLLWFTSIAAIAAMVPLIVLLLCSPAALAAGQEAK